MDFGGMNYLAIVTAAIAAFAFGAAYYGLVGARWVRAARLKPEEMKMSPMPFVTSFVAELVMAWILAGVIGHLGTGQVTLWNGVVSAAFLWFGFIATTIAVNHRYQGFGWDLTLIDAAHWLGVMLIMGAVIGWFGV
jgi:hypothetical protein